MNGEEIDWNSIDPERPGTWPDEWVDWSTEMVRDEIEAHEEQEAQADYGARDTGDAEATPASEDDEPEAEPPLELPNGGRVLECYIAAFDDDWPGSPEKMTDGYLLRALHIPKAERGSSRAYDALKKERERRQESNERARQILKKLARHLRSLGLLAVVVPGQWEVQRDRPRYWQPNRIRALAIVEDTSDPRFGTDAQRAIRSLHEVNDLNLEGGIFWNLGERVFAGHQTVQNFVTTFKGDLGDLEPSAGETMTDYAKRMMLPADRVRKLAALWEMSGRDVEMFEKLNAPRNTTAHGTSWLVGGLLPRQRVGLLIGAPSSGKSSLALQLTVDIAARRPVFGLEYGPDTGKRRISAYVFAEDPEEEVKDRVIELDPDRMSLGSLLLMNPAGNLERFLDKLEAIPDLDLVVIDTASEFLGGNVNDGITVRKFMIRLRALAESKNCAVLVLHHSNKATSPRTASQWRAEIKGSGEFESAARYVLTLRGTGDEPRVLGVVKSNLPRKDPILASPIHLVFDIETGRVAPATEQPAKPAAATSAISDVLVPADTDAVVAAVREVNALGHKVARRSGKNELYNHSPKPIAGWQRKRVRDAVEAAIASGKLVAIGGHVTPL